MFVERDYRLKTQAELDFNRKGIEDQFKVFIDAFPNITIIQNEELLKQEELDFTILIFHGIWSGPSIMIGKKILSDLSPYLNDGIKIYIIDIDTVRESFIKALLDGIARGYSESVFYENGQINAKHYFQQSLIPFLSYVKMECENRKHNM